jgi:hypothetical protein
MEGNKQGEAVRKLVLKDYDVGETLGTGKFKITQDPLVESE